jgi:hypothetical protein
MPAGDFLFESKDFANLFLLSFAAWTRGRRGARGRRCQDPPLSLYSSTWHRPRPPVVARHTADTPELTPLGRDRLQPRHADLAVAMPAVGTLAEPARHRPSPALSLRRRPHTKPRDQFPKPAQPETDRVRCPGRAISTRRRRPECPERCHAPPYTHTRSRPVRHTTVHGNQRPTQHHHRLAPTSPRLTPASLGSDPTRLKPSIIRPNPCATNTPT